MPLVGLGLEIDVVGELSGGEGDGFAALLGGGGGMGEAVVEGEVAGGDVEFEVGVGGLGFEEDFEGVAEEPGGLVVSLHVGMDIEIAKGGEDEESVLTSAEPDGSGLEAGIGVR